MLKVLVPADGSDNALGALRHVASRETTCRQPAEICPLAACRPGVVRMFLSRRDLQGDYKVIRLADEPVLLIK
jgi:hypothetical protein